MVGLLTFGDTVVTSNWAGRRQMRVELAALENNPFAHYHVCMHLHLAPFVRITAS